MSDLLLAADAAASSSSSTLTTNARLAHIDLIPSSSVSHSVTGSFSAPDVHDEMVIARCDSLEIVRIVGNQAWKVIHREPVFGTIRAMACLPSPSRATQQDCLVVTSDSGSVSLLKFNPVEHRFEVESEDFFGRSGMRRTVPGQYIAVEPATATASSSSSSSSAVGGRAIMISALETLKLVYPVHHTTDASTGAPKTILLSPIEINRPASVTFCLVPLQEASSSSSSGSNSNIIRFASIESEKNLGVRNVIIYEYDSSLQSCSAALSIPVTSSAPPSSLIPIPGNNSLHCSLGAIVVVCSPGDEQVHTLLLQKYDAERAEQQQQQQQQREQGEETNSVRPVPTPASTTTATIAYEQIDTTVPRRLELSPKEPAVFITGVYAQVKTRGVFTLMMNELGDVYTVVLEKANKDSTSTSSASAGAGGGILGSPVNAKLVVRYFDTLPNAIVAQCACLLRTGAFAVFGENGSNGIFTVRDLGRKDDSYITKTFNVKTIVRKAATASSISSGRSRGLLGDAPPEELIINREVKQFAATPNQLKFLQPILGAACTGGAGPTSCPTLQMSLFPNNVFSNLMTGGAGGDNDNNNQQQQSNLLQFNTKKFITVRGKGFNNSSVSLVQFGHRADVVAEYNLPFAFESAIVLPRSRIFLLCSAANNATLVFSSDRFEVLNSGGDDNSGDDSSSSNSTGFVSNLCTLSAFELPDKGGIIQVHRNGMRHIAAAGVVQNQQHQNQPPQFQDWSHPSGRKIQFASSNTAGQLLLSFEGGHGLMLFEYDRQVGAMRIVAPNDKIDNISCLAVAPPLSSSSKALLGAIGLGGNYKQVMFVWLVNSPNNNNNPNDRHPQKALHHATKPLGFHSAPVSISFARMGTANTLFAVIGLEDGTVIRIPIDQQTAHVDEDVLEDLPEIGCGEGPAMLYHNNNNNNNGDGGNNNSMSEVDKCCFAVSSGNIWRLSVQDRETHTQVPVTISTTSSSLTTFSSSSSSSSSSHLQLAVCPLKTSKLPNGLLILNPSQRILAAASVDAVSPFNETILKRPSPFVHQQHNNNNDNAVNFSSCRMIRRMMLSKEGNVGVVLENEKRSRSSVIQSLTLHNDMMSRIRQREEDEARLLAKENDDDDEDDDAIFAPDDNDNNSKKAQQHKTTTATKSSSYVPITTDTLKQQTNNNNNDIFSTSSWSLETFSVQDSLHHGNNQNSNSGASSTNNDTRRMFSPEMIHSNNNSQQQQGSSSSMDSSATAMVVGSIRVGSKHLTTSTSSMSDSSSGSGENIVVSVIQQDHKSNIVSSLLYTFSFNYAGHLSFLHATYVNSFNIGVDNTNNNKTNTSTSEDPLTNKKQLLSTALSNTASALHILPNSHWLIVGHGKSVSFYGLGREQLIRKHFVAEAVPNKVVSICSSEEEILCVADAHESVFLYKIGHYNPNSTGGAGGNSTMGRTYSYKLQHEQQQQQSSSSSSSVNDIPIAVLFADDYIPRHITCCTFVDPSTVAVGDRFGNISIVRFSYEAVALANAMLKTAINHQSGRKSMMNQNEDDDEESSSYTVAISPEAKRLKGAPKKIEEIARFFVGQTIVSIDREYQITTKSVVNNNNNSTTTTTTNPNEIIPLYYCTSIGKVGALLPIAEDDFQHLTRVERELRNFTLAVSSSSENEQQQQQDSSSTSGRYRPLTGRDHCAYRSSFGPVVGVVDVAFIEHVWRIAKQQQQQQQQQRGNTNNSSSSVEQLIDTLVMEAQIRNENFGLPSVGARPLETGLSELHARAIGNVE